jgi:NADH-quinone oxidoreductase subunit K
MANRRTVQACAYPSFVHSSFVIPSAFDIRASPFHKMLTLGHYLIVSGMLFTIGFAGVLLRRNIIIIFMSLELMLNAANLSLVAFSRFRVGADGMANYNAQVFVFFIITVAAAEVAVGLAIIVALYRARQTTNVEDISTLKF